MRARGAQATDIVILVVAAGRRRRCRRPRKPCSTRKRQVSAIVVAVNKIDKPEGQPGQHQERPGASRRDPGRVGRRRSLRPGFAKLGTGVDELLEAVLLQAEVLELKATPSAPGRGVVVESRLDKGRGPVATVLVQDGTLRQGDMVLVGINYGRVRAMLDENGKPIKEAGPSIPVEILGLDGTPDAR
ncbi:translation initiation factor IF-2 [Pseudomonas aeruginosa]|nr:translation initiation factor IF-2 [Pseudomonas aeruginosa]